MAADDKYNPAFFELFRKEDITKTAVKFAQVSSQSLVANALFFVTPGWRLSGRGDSI